MGHIALVQSTMVIADYQLKDGKAQAAIDALREEMRIAAIAEWTAHDWNDPDKAGDAYAAMLIGPVSTAANGYYIVILIPDGSKAGWDTHDQFTEWRCRLQGIAEEFAYGHCTHVVLNGGDDQAHVIDNIDGWNGYGTEGGDDDESV